MESEQERNEGEIFCLIGSFLNRIKNDFGVMTKKGILVFDKNAELVITDKTRGRIIKELHKIYKVIEKQEG